MTVYLYLTSLTDSYLNRYPNHDFDKYYQSYQDLYGNTELGLQMQEKYKAFVEQIWPG